MTTTSRASLQVWPAVLCAAAGAALFQFWGNSTHGYIATNSLFYWWTYQWVNPQSETQHAWLILGISIYLFARNVRAKSRVDGPIPGAALAALAGGLALHAVGFIAEQPRVSILALLLYVWGVMAVCGGRGWGRAAVFPVGFMVFAIPVNVLDTVGFWLQMWVVQAGERIAHLVGIGVVRNGTQLFAPDGRYQYDVVAACSGIRSLMALTALSLFIGYLWFKPFWLRAALLLVSLPFVYLGNVARISSIVIAAQVGGQRWGDRVHDVMGFGVFAIVLGGVIAVAELVARVKPAWAVDPEPDANPAGPAPRLRPALIAGVVVLLAVADAGYLSYRASQPADDRPGVVLSADGADPVELPTYLGSAWMGRTVQPDPIERTILPPDTGFSRKLYLNLDHPGQTVLLSVVLSGRDRTSIHRPELCLVGQGWSIEGTRRHRFDYPRNPSAAFEATVLEVHREVHADGQLHRVPAIVVYWFVGDDRVVASQGARMLYDAWSRVVHGRAPRWAYVLLLTGSTDGADAALARVQAILSETLPAFQPAAAARS
jgi:exosortase